MSNVLQNFLDGETIPLSATTTSSSVAWKLPGSWAAKDVMICNTGSNVAFVGFVYSGDATVPLAGLPGSTTNTNNTKCTPIPAGAIMILAKNKGSRMDDTCIAITATGVTQLYFTAGQGN